MYQVETSTNGSAFKASPVKFITPDIALRHAEKLADQFITISDYRVRNVHTNQIVEFSNDEAL